MKPDVLRKAKEEIDQRHFNSLRIPGMQTSDGRHSNCLVSRPLRTAIVALDEVN
jgi:hypothetical protein